MFNAFPKNPTATAKAEVAAEAILVIAVKALVLAPAPSICFL